MANIITRTFSDGPNKAVQLGVYVPGPTGSLDSGVYRTLSYGTNWKYLRMGILCGIVDYISPAYNRMMGISMGFSSGSKTLNNFPSGSATCLAAALGKFSNSYGINSPEARFISVNEPISGSLFYADNSSGLGGVSNGVVDAGSTGMALYPCISNLGDTNKRRSILIFEASQSSNTGYNVAMYGLTNTTIVSKNGNRDFTSSDLLAALTGSTTNLSASRVGLDRSFLGVTHATNSLNTAFIEYAGGIPFEVYDWYIYKLG